MIVTCCMLWTGCNREASNVVQGMDEPTKVLTPSVTMGPTLTTILDITKEPTPTIVQEDNWFNRQLNMVFQEHPQYKGYVMEKYPFDNVYAVVFQPQDAKKDFLEYYCDLWVFGEGSCTKIEGNTYISYESFQTGEIEGKSYFRYDLSYPTDSVTILLMMDDQHSAHKISLGGSLREIEGRDLTVTQSSYDMLYMITDGYPSGHTWKPYYFYLKDYDLIAYHMNEIEKEQFLTYKNATGIMETITNKYDKSKQTLQMVFLSVENGLIIVNIKIDNIDSYEYYYETYRVNSDQTLEHIESGEGTYAGLMLDETKYVNILDYSDKENTLTVQIVEWLCPWKEEDKIRIQELIDSKSIEDSDAIWESEIYLYANPNSKITYRLADSVKLTLRDQDMTLHQVDKDVLNDDLSNLLLSITVSNQEIYEITEPYMP